MSERAEGRMDWEFGSPQAIGAVPKFIAEVRAAVAMVSPDVDDEVEYRQIEEAFACIVDALKAFDEAAKAETVNG